MSKTNGDTVNGLGHLKSRTTSGSVITNNKSEPQFEIFVRKLPLDMTQDELKGVVGVFGEIENLRLIKHKTGSCNRFAFINYKCKSDGVEALQRLNGMEIRPGFHLDVSPAHSNCRLFVGNIPKSKGKEELLQEFRKITPELKDVITYRSPDSTYQKNRGFCFLEYENHLKTSKALKSLIIHKPNRFFDCDYVVDWADQEETPTNEVMTEIKVVYIRNVSSNVTDEQLKAVFGICGEIERVKKIKNFAFVHFLNRKDAEEAITTFNGKKLGGANIEVAWARPATCKTKREEMLRNREIRTTQLLMGKAVKPIVPNPDAPPETFSAIQNTAPFNYNRYSSSYDTTPENWRNPLNGTSGFGDQMQLRARQSNTSTHNVPTYPNYFEEPYNKQR